MTHQLHPMTFLTVPNVISNVSLNRYTPNQILCTFKNIFEHTKARNPHYSYPPPPSNKLWPLPYRVVKQILIIKMYTIFFYLWWTPFVFTKMSGLTYYSLSYLHVCQWFLYSWICNSCPSSLCETSCIIVNFADGRGYFSCAWMSNLSPWHV